MVSENDHESRMIHDHDRSSQILKSILTSRPRFNEVTRACDVDCKYVSGSLVSFHEALDAQNKVAFTTISGLDFIKIMPGCTAQKLLLIMKCCLMNTAV